ncbi:carbonic anhydrase-related protein-like [Venturia canescens]|uniref:carbonic anhydrase-related protein-like n=1 Tax=Venturia canescens TaxID=32260 RepID=UPI001C9C96E5|nr:carbonic anhydrase-related protein-like [Venturia canescens]
MSNNIVGLMKKGSSPINLDDRYVKFKKFAPLILNGHWLKDGDAYLSNNGETAMIQLSGHRIPSTVTGGPLVNDVYEFTNTHFHWRKENSNGSEHQINGTCFSMEAHVVHWNRKYLTFDKCLQHKDGLAILTYFFLVTEKNCDGNNPLVEKITDYLKYVVEPNTEINIPANSLCWMRNATYCPKYYTYAGTYNKGSTPECATWIVFPLIIPISACQIEEFRKLRNHEGARIMENCKDIQTPNGRRIFLVANSH